jgi:hypothetical protein
MLSLSFSRVAAARRIPVFLPAPAANPGFLAHARHARGNDNHDCAGTKTPSLYSASINSLAAGAQRIDFGRHHEVIAVQAANLMRP